MCLKATAKVTGLHRKFDVVSFSLDNYLIEKTVDKNIMREDRTHQ